MAKRRNRRTRLGLPCVLVLAACAAFASHASAETKQLEFSFDDGRINIGQFKGERLVDPAVPERIASLTGLIETTTGDFAASASGLVIPAKTFQNVSTPGGDADVVIHFSAAGPISGNLAPLGGALRTDSLSVNAVVDVYQAGQPEAQSTLMARCEVGPVPLPLRSDGVLIDDSDSANPIAYEGASFTPRGAAVATWEELPPSRPVGGTFGPLFCPMVDEMAAGPGGVWLAGLADLTETPAAPIAGATDKEGARAAKKCKRAKKKAGKRKRRCRKKR